MWTRRSSRRRSTWRSTRSVAEQREVGLDVISDGEMSKSGFSTYVNDRFSGLAGHAPSSTPMMSRRSRIWQ